LQNLSSRSLFAGDFGRRQVFHGLALSESDGYIRLSCGERNRHRLIPAAKLRQPLDMLAGRTAPLANEGDFAARNVVADPRRQGITFDPSATPIGMLSCP
jgi:hypothetical protein